MHKNKPDTPFTGIGAGVKKLFTNISEKVKGIGSPKSRGGVKVSTGEDRATVRRDYAAPRPSRTQTGRSGYAGSRTAYSQRTRPGKPRPSQRPGDRRERRERRDTGASRAIVPVKSRTWYETAWDFVVRNRKVVIACAGGAVVIAAVVTVIAVTSLNKVSADAQAELEAQALLEARRRATELLEAQATPTPSPTPEPTPPPLDPLQGDVIALGTVNSTVTRIQQRLMELYYMGEDEPSEEFNEGTSYALTLFQRKHDLEMTGEVDALTYEMLMSEEARPYTVGLETEGTDVEELQTRLYELGYIDKVTGYFGTDTEAAVKEFQERNGLMVDGNVGNQTREKLYSEDVRAHSYSMGDEGGDIKKYQNRLKELGYLTTTPDGKYGEDTVAAVKRFQENNGLIADGYIGPATKELLMSASVTGNALQIGAKGDDVENMQRLLRNLGYLKSVTGYFGSDTDTAVRNFQKQNKLAVDGKVGAVTMNVLTSDKAKAASGSAAVVTGSNVNSFITVARSKLGCKYVLGAKGPNTFDCSGFVYWCLNQVGVKQGYMTSAGWQKTGKYQRIASMSDIKKGDVISFKGHVGIALGGGQMIDASSSQGKIRITSLNSSYWKTNFVCAYRIF